MDNRGNFTLEIVVAGIIVLLIFGIILAAAELSEEKISKSIENNNIEKTISEVSDSLINDAGTPINWENFKPKRIGLATTNENDNVIPNSVSYYKLLELGNDYDNYVTKRIFNNKFHSSMELIPHETSISSVKIGSNHQGTDNVYSVNRVVKCDFFKKYVVCDFLGDGKCNHNHNQKNHCCNYLKLFKGNLKSMDYYLLFDDDEKNNVKYSIDTTHFKGHGDGKSVSRTEIYLNSYFSDLFEEGETSSIIFIHLNKKDTKAVLVAVPKHFDKRNLNYDYFTTQTCDFIIEAWS